MDYTTRDLICLRLGEVGGVPEEGPVPEAVTVPGLGEALELGDSVSDRVALLTDLEALKDDGLVTEQVRPVPNLNERRRAYVLTPAGEERAAELRGHARQETVTITNGTTEEVPLGEVEQFFDDAPLVRALARMTPDGSVPIDRRESDRFVGRTTELDRLRDAYDALETRGGHAVLVGGESGVGKSTLVDEFVDRLDDRAAVARATAEPDSGRPYEIVRQVYDALPLEADATALLADADPPDDQAAAVAGQRQALFADFADAFRDIAEEQPLVLVFEDVHNADEQTLALVSHLVDALGQWVFRVLFVLTYRPEVVAGDHALRDLIETAETTSRHDHLELDTLGIDATEALLRLSLDVAELPAEFVTTIHRQTGGNPLYVEAIASRLSESDLGTDEGPALPDTAADIDVPETVSRAVQERLAVLDEKGRRVLDVGAVVGEKIDPAVLLAAVDLPDPTVRDYVDLLVESGIWERADGVLAFVHGVVRETVLDALPADRQTASHRQVAGAIEAVAGDVDSHAGSLARHYDAAGQRAAAARTFETAGDQAVAVYAYDIALESYERGLAAARASSDVSDERVRSLASAATHVNLLVGDLDAAASTLATARTRAPADDGGSDPDLAVLASRLAIARGAFEEALATVADALDHLGIAEGDDASFEPGDEQVTGAARDGSDRPAVAGTDRVEVACRLLGLRADAEMRRGNHDVARAAASHQRDLAEGAGSQRQRARAHSRLGRVARHQADFSLMRTHYEAALAIYERLGADYDIAEAKHGMAIAALKEGDAAGALARFREARETFEEMGARPKLAKSHSNIGKTYLHQGRYDAATEAFERALALDREVGNRHLEAKTLFNLGLVASEQEEHDEAREYFERARSICEDLGDAHGMTISRVRLGLVLIAQGSFDEAAEHVREALETAQEIGATSAVATARMARGDLARARDDPDAAREAYAVALETFRESGERNETATVSRKLAALALESGDTQTAWDHGMDALVGFEDLGAVPDLLETHRLLVETAVDAGDPEAARTYCDRALDLFEVEETPPDLPVDRTWFEDRRATPGDGADVADDEPAANDP